MADLRAWWGAHRPTNRRLAQLFCAVLYNANLKGFTTGQIYTGSSKTICVPGLNCYSCPGAIGSCPLGALQNTVSASNMRSGSYVIGILLLFGVMLGRTVCGWMCPVGFGQEILYKIPTPKLKKNRITRGLSYLKYIALVVLVLALPLWYSAKQGMPVPAFCKFVCPAGTVSAFALLAHPSNSVLFSLLGSLFQWKVAVLIVIVVASVICFRPFCRFLCPLGAIYGLFNRISVIGIKVDEERCTRCGACVRHCKMDVRSVGDHECIHCGSCRSVCPAQAIAMMAGSHKFEERSKISDGKGVQ